MEIGACCRIGRVNADVLVAKVDGCCYDGRVEEAVSELIKRLNEIQDSMGLSNAAFGRLIGVDRVTWSLTRRGKRPLGKTVIDGALRLRPELSYVYAQSLQERPTTSADMVEAKAS